MTGQHRKPSPDKATFLVRPVDADRVREAISSVVADAINKAAETLNKIRVWCDTEATVCRDQIAAGTCVSGTDTYCAECVETAKARLKAIEEVRDLLPASPEAAGEVTSCTKPE